MLADIGFLNSLWSGDAIENTKNTDLKQALLRAHKLLRTNMVISLVLFLMFIIGGLLSA